MEKRIEKWESLRLEAQKFAPQEFVAQCELTVIGHEIIINETTDAFKPNLHMILDLPKPEGDGAWTEADRNQNPNKPYTSDNNAPSVGTTLVFYGSGWDNGSNPGKPSDYPVGYDFASHGFTYVTAFMPKNSSNLHVYKADWTDILAKNNS